MFSKAIQFMALKEADVSSSVLVCFPQSNLPLDLTAYVTSRFPSTVDLNPPNKIVKSTVAPVSVCPIPITLFGSLLLAKTWSPALAYNSGSEHTYPVPLGDALGTGVTGAGVVGGDVSAGPL
jgi:hypothetical protein